VLIPAVRDVLHTYLDRVNVSTAAAGFSKEVRPVQDRDRSRVLGLRLPYLVFQIIAAGSATGSARAATLNRCGIVWARRDRADRLAGGLISMLSHVCCSGLGEGATFPAATSAMSRWSRRAARLRAGHPTHAAARIATRFAPAGDRRDHEPATAGAEAFYVCAADQLRLGRAVARASPSTQRAPAPSRRPRSPRCPPPKAKGVPVPWKALFKRAAVTSSTSATAGRCWLFLSWIPQYFLHATT